jgi:hypothetical protein
MQRRGRSTAIATLFLGWRQGESGSGGSWCYNRHGTGGISGKEAVQRGSEGFRGVQRGGGLRGVGLRGVKMKISMAKDSC